MTEQDILRRLNELSESDVDGLRRLAEEIGSFCREPASTILTEWAGRPPNRQPTCAFVCSQLKELAVGEMLHHVDSVDPAMRVQWMEIVVMQQLAFRELLLTALEPLLKDFTPAGTTASGHEARACDAAYLLARKMVQLRASEAEQFSAENEFTARKQIQRDDEIDQWLMSETWKEIFPDPP